MLRDDMKLAEVGKVQDAGRSERCGGVRGVGESATCGPGPPGDGR